jgi:hypothetical protein
MRGVELLVEAVGTPGGLPPQGLRRRAGNVDFARLGRAAAASFSTGIDELDRVAAALRDRLPCWWAATQASAVDAAFAGSSFDG